MATWQFLLTFIGGGGVLAFIQFLINRRDEKNGKFKSIIDAIDQTREEIKNLRHDFQEQKVTEARIRILRFSDELKSHHDRSEESYDQILDDIDLYERYCKEHPEYENNKAVTAIANIKNSYTKHIFLE